MAQTRFSSRLKSLLLLALALNTLVLGLQVYSSYHGIRSYRDSLLAQGDMLLRSVAGGHRFFMRHMSFSADEAQRYFREAFEQTPVKAFFLYDGTGQVLFSLHPQTHPVDMPRPASRLVREEEDALLFFAPYTPPRLGMGMMGGRPVAPLYMALALDKAPLLELEGKTWVHLAFVVLLQVLLVFVYLVLLRFIRHHLRTQERLEVAERHAELGRFAGVLAHEIKNPLSSLRGLLAFARQKEQDAVLREVQEKSLDEVDRLNRIADDFLTYGKETVLDCEEVALLPLVRRALELVHYEMESKGLACYLRGDDFTVSADGDRLLQVLVNLLLNAAQAAPPGGRVELAFDAARRSLKIANPVAEPVTATAEQLFAPFYSTRSQGSGLGLAIARKLLEAHGFSVRLTATAPFTLLLEFSHDPS